MSTKAKEAREPKPDRHPNGVPRTVHSQTPEGPVYEDELESRSESRDREEERATRPASPLPEAAPPAPEHPEVAIAAALVKAGYSAEEAAELAANAVAEIAKRKGRGGE
jgi:hypothetical protein